MALLVRIKTEFGDLEAKLASIPGIIDAELPEIINRHGNDILHAAEAVIAERLGIPVDAVAADLTRHDATPLDAEFELQSEPADSGRFPYVRWITQGDDKVCPICAPRDGVVYTVAETRYMFPAHPNCRCELEPVDLGGELVSVATDALSEALNSVSNEALDIFTREWDK